MDRRGVGPHGERSHRVVPGVGERSEVGHGATLLDLVAGMPLEALREVCEGDEELALADVGQLGEARRRAAIHPCGLGVADDPAQAGVRELGPADGVVGGAAPGGLDDLVVLRTGAEGVVVLVLDDTSGRSRSGPSPPG